MATKKTVDTQDPEVAIESAINQTEDFIQRNGKNLLTALVVVVLVVGGYFGYKYLWAAPRAVKAADMMYVAQQQFAIDSFALALNGDGNNAGFLEVIEKYPSTPQGNLAKHYAGICYMQTNDLDNALEFLKKYDVTEGIPNAIINAQNRGLIGDIYSQKGDLDKAVAEYEKAAELSGNSFTAPYYLKKAGLVYVELGKTEKAIAAFQSIADNYATSMEAREIEKFIGQQEQK